MCVSPLHTVRHDILVFSVPLLHAIWRLCLDLRWLGNLNFCRVITVSSSLEPNFPSKPTQQPLEMGGMGKRAKLPLLCWVDEMKRDCNVGKLSGWLKILVSRLKVCEGLHKMHSVLMALYLLFVIISVIICLSTMKIECVYLKVLLAELYTIDACYNHNSKRS